MVVAGMQMAAAQQLTLPTPPGTTRLQDSLFIDNTEVANIHWKEFLYYALKDSGEAYYYRMLPDTLVWAQRNLPNPQLSSLDLTEKYFRAPEYHSFPVVGISYQQAQEYARWRSAVVTQLLNKPEELQKRGLRGKKIMVEYRLPTEEEWIAAAAGSLSLDDYPYGYKKYMKRNRKLFDPKHAYQQLEEPKPPFKTFKKELRKTKLPIFHVVAELPPDISLAPEFPKPIASGNANSRGLHQMIGNVAEMTAAPGIAKGGSFMHTLEDSNIQAQQAYYGPAPWLGLRYVATVWIVEEKQKSNDGF